MHFLFKTVYASLLTKELFAQVANGSATFGIGHLPFDAYLRGMVDIGSPWNSISLVLITREPKHLPNAFAIFRPYSLLAWILLIFTLFCLSTSFLFFHQAYSALSKHGQQCLLRPASSKMEFYLYGMLRYTEPDALPWFPSWETKAGMYAFKK